MTEQPNPARPADRRLSIALWLLIALAYLTFFILDLHLDYNQILTPCAGPGCNWAAITQAEVDVLESRGLTTRAYAVGYAVGISMSVAVYWLTGGLIFWRQRADRVGLFMSLALLVIPITVFADASNVIEAYPGLAFAPVALSVVGNMILFLFVYIFPNGRFYPRWGVYIFIATALVSTVASLAFEGFLNLGVTIDSSIVLLMVAGLFAALIFQVLRYRRASTEIERQQTKWVLLGFAVFLVMPALWGALYPGEANFQAGVTRLLATSLGWLVLNLGMLVLPITLALAIFRHRLWDIDLLIRRTLIYGLLTGLLALVYFGSITTLQALFSSFSENQSQAAIVISTLVIAALFNPLRQRLQETIDRRFFRARYDSELSLARFAAAARDEVDVDRLAWALQGVVEETVQPERMSLWLR